MIMLFGPAEVALVIQVSWLELKISTELQGAFPTSTLTPGAKPLPVIVSMVPPVAGIFSGVTALT